MGSLDGPSPASALGMHHRYLRHLDGIRALAVVPVVFFHLLPVACPGGFAGVDVFFLLSGFLVTRRVLSDLNAGSFRLSGFYHRRIRRIVPAYFVLVIVVFIAGCALFYGDPLVHLADASIMATWFSANVYFYKIGGSYFGQSVQESPLLHLWSLGVEEQFYLLLPFVCIGARRFWPRGIPAVLSVLCALSLAAAIRAVASGEATRAFYLLPYRAWELFAGALLAAVESNPMARGEEARASWMRGVGGMGGLLLVVLPYVAWSADTPFPGLAAVPSVVGAALLVRFGGQGPVSRLLSARPLVWIGRMSYSIYLWHWPVFVLWTYACFGNVGWLERCEMLLVALALGAASWRFVEEPVRRSPAWGERKSFGLVAVCMTGVTAVGLSCVFSKGWANSLHVNANRFAYHEFEGQFVETILRNGLYRLGALLGVELAVWPALPLEVLVEGTQHVGVPERTDILILGDSHADALLYGLDRGLRKRERGGESYTKHNEIVFDPNGGRAKKALEWIAKWPDASTVLLAQFWSSSQYENVGIDENLRKFASEVRALGKKLYVVLDPPVWRVSPGDLRARIEIVRPVKVPPEFDEVLTVAQYEKLQGGLNIRLASISREAGGDVVPVQDVFRRGGKFVAFDEERHPPIGYYRDRNHLSPEGSMIAGSYILSRVWGRID